VRPGMKFALDVLHRALEHLVGDVHLARGELDPEEAREDSEEQRDLVAADVGLGDGLCDGEVDLEREAIAPLEVGARGFDDVAQSLRLSLRVTKLLAQIRDIVGRR